MTPSKQRVNCGCTFLSAIPSIHLSNNANHAFLQNICVGRTSAGGAYLQIQVPAKRAPNHIPAVFRFLCPFTQQTCAFTQRTCAFRHPHQYYISWFIFLNHNTRGITLPIDLTIPVFSRCGVCSTFPWLVSQVFLELD